MSFKSFFLFLCSCFLVQAFTFRAWSDGRGVSQEKYNDFYRRQTQLKKDEERREKGRLKYITSKKVAEKNIEKLEADFAKKSRSVDQEKQDRIAEEWMEQQNLKHEQNMNKARQKYISNRKENYRFKIPEAEEFDVK